MGFYWLLAIVSDPGFFFFSFENLMCFQSVARIIFLKLLVNLLFLLS